MRGGGCGGRGAEKRLREAGSSVACNAGATATLWLPRREGRTASSSDLRRTPVHPCPTSHSCCVLHASIRCSPRHSGCFSAPRRTRAMRLRRTTFFPYGHSTTPKGGAQSGITPSKRIILLDKCLTYKSRSGISVRPSCRSGKDNSHFSIPPRFVRDFGPRFEFASGVISSGDAGCGGGVSRGTRLRTDQIRSAEGAEVM
jgi:hypothetical protein